MPPPLQLSSRSLRTTDSPISYFIQLALEQPRFVSLAAGLVDEASLPVSDVAAAMAEVLGEAAKGRVALQYGTTQGLPALRQRILDRFTSADGTRPAEASLTADHVVLTTGSQEMLSLTADAVVDPGDIVITEAPTYFVFGGVLEGVGARVLTVPMDEHGMDIDALEELLRQLDHQGELERLKLIYTCDYFQNPTGLTLSVERRQRLVELVRHYSRSHRILILEDGAYRELRYEGPDLPSIKKFDPTNEHVIWTSTFSKPCSPGLKTGFGILPADLVAPVLRLKANHDFGSSNLIQHAIDRLLANGSYDRHVAQLRSIYRHKRDTMLAALTETFAGQPGVSWTHPAGGLYVWFRFPDELPCGPGSPLLEAALREGVLYIPGEHGYLGLPAGAAPRHEARLSFGVASPEALREGVRRLGRAVSSAARAAVAVASA